jgi:hypothetical protein
MLWNLFLDDERNPEDVTWAPWQVREKYRNEEWVIVRDGLEATHAIADKGCYPSFISFDHDLGDSDDGETGYDYAKRLVDMDMDKYHPRYKFPENFSFYVHSQNPVGKANIEGLLNNYMKHKD